jgi:8-oxo-dGTP diphosphatase
MHAPKCPLLTVDAVIFTDEGYVLIKRKNPPFQGDWALPGGFVDVGETVEAAAVREAKEETGLDIELVALLGVYSDPARDPRGHTVSVVYIARAVGGCLQGADDASQAAVFTPRDTVPLAFDHELILKHALDAVNDLGLLCEND